MSTHKHYCATCGGAADVEGLICGNCGNDHEEFITQELAEKDMRITELENENRRLGREAHYLGHWNENHKDKRIAELKLALSIHTSHTIDEYQRIFAKHDAEIARKAVADITQEVHLVFTTIGGEQGHMEHLVFVESEDKSGRSIRLGDITRRDDGLYELVIQVVR